MTYIAMNTSLPLPTCPATHLQNYAEPLPNADIEDIVCERLHLAHYFTAYRTAYEPAREACTFPLQNEITIENPDDCFKSIPHLLQQTEKMRACINSIRHRETIDDDFQPHFLAQYRAAQEFSTACAASQNSETELKTPTHCLKSLNTYIDQAEKTRIAENEAVPSESPFRSMYSFGTVLRGFQHIYRILLKMRGIE